MHHLRTTDKQFTTLLLGDHVEKQKQNILNYIKDEEAHAVFVENEIIDPTNATRQRGRTMTSDALEAKLRPLLPLTVSFINHPKNSTKKAIVRHTPDGYETLCCYENGIMPEHSIMQGVVKEVPDSDVISRRKSISRKDINRFEFVPGVGYIFDETQTRPGFKKIKQIGRELERGWRTVLIRLLSAGIISIGDIERNFDNDNTPEWAKFTGRQLNVETWN